MLSHVQSFIQQPHREPHERRHARSGHFGGFCGEDFLSFMDFIHNAQEKGSGPQTGRTASL